jgi:sugar phosphate isomerase/epimerase
MITRRKFVQLSAAALPSLARPLWGQGHSLKLGLQLYTLRQIAGEDLPAILRQVRAIGYQEVELTSLQFALPASELRKVIENSGLTAPSGHFDYTELSAKFDYARDLGLQWMVCPVLPKAQWTSSDGFHDAAIQFNNWGKRARDLGMRFAFHNHAYEFRQFDRGTGFDLLVRETDPELVSFELDCYWVAEAGRDPRQLLDQLGRRVRMLHLKDRKPGFPPSTKMGPDSAHFTEVGNGTIDWRGVLALAQKLEVEHYFVEQDKTDGPPMESVRTSYNYLRKILA